MLLDFDGPVTHFFINGRNQRLANRLRKILDDSQLTLPSEVDRTLDPLAVLRWAALHSPPGLVQVVDAACVDGEYECADESEPTRGRSTPCGRAEKPGDLL